MNHEKITLTKSDETKMISVDSNEQPNTSIKYSCYPNNVGVLQEIKINWNNDTIPETYNIKCIIEYMLQS